MLYIFYDIPGAKIYARIYNEFGHIYNRSSQIFEEFNEQNLLDYCVGDVEDTEGDVFYRFDKKEGNLYFSTFPSNISEGKYLVNILAVTDVSPTINDKNISEEIIFWDGNKEIDVSSINYNINGIGKVSPRLEE